MKSEAGWKSELITAGMGRSHLTRCSYGVAAMLVLCLLFLSGECLAAGTSSNHFPQDRSVLSVAPLNVVLTSDAVAQAEQIPSAMQMAVSLQSGFGSTVDPDRNPVIAPPPTSTGPAHSGLAVSVPDGSGDRIPCEVIAEQLKDHSRAVLEPILPRLIKQMTNPDPVARSEAARYLGIGRFEEGVALLSEHLASDADKTVRARCAASLGCIGSAVALPVLVDALNDSERNVRLAAAISLSGLGEKTQCLEALAQALNDSDRNVRMKGLSGLHNVATDSARSLLQGALTDSDPYVVVLKCHDIVY